jgi:hypothetical protein
MSDLPAVRPIPRNPDATSAAFRDALERGDIDSLVATLAPDTVLHSPITGLTHFEGPDEIHKVLSEVFEVLVDRRHQQELGDDEWRALFYSARVDDMEVEEATRLRLDDEGRVAEIWLYIRPLPGLARFAARLAPRLARHTGLVRVAATRLLVAWLPAITRLGDQLTVRVVSPPRMD